MARPLYYDGVNTLQEMSDAQLEQLIYYLQVAYANQLDNNGVGRLFIGNTDTLIGTASDTISTQQTNSTAAPSIDNINQTYPAYPGIGTAASGTYNYRQDTNVPPFPGNGFLDADGYVIIDPASAGNIAVANTDAHFYDEIISEAVNQIRNGNEVGSYRVATTTPTSGGAGSWKNKTVWFRDDRYSNIGNITYRLYLKTGLTTIPGTTVYPIGIASSLSGNLEQRSLNGRLMTYVLLPLLTRRLSSGDLTYTVDTTATNSRGSFSDTRYNTAINDQYAGGTGTSEVYYSRSTPDTTGTTIDVTTYYLNMA